MKKRLIKIIAVYLSIAMLLPVLLIPEIFAQDSNDAYKTYLMDIGASGATSGTGLTQSNNSSNTNADFSGVDATTITYGWSDAATMNNTSAYLYASVAASAEDGTEIDGIPYKADKYVDAEGNILGTIKNGDVTDNEGNPHGTFKNGKFTYDGKEYSSFSNVYKVNPTDAVMFYVKLPFQAPETEMLFQVATASLAVHEDSFGKKTIYPAVDANQWLILQKNAPVYFLEKGYDKWTTSKTVNSTVDTSKGNLVFPAGFEGWVRIPVSSLSEKPEKSFYAFRFNMYQKQMGGKYTEGGIQVGSFMFVEDGEKEYFKAIVNEPDSSSQNVELIKNRPHSTVSMLDVNTVTNSKKVDNETHLSDGYTYKLSNTSTQITLKSSKKLGADGGLMFYYKQPIDKDGKLEFKAEAASLINGADIYTLSRGKLAWDKIAVNANGEISLNKGFEGYIYVPTASLSDAQGKNIGKIQLSNLTKDASVGTVLLVDDFDGSSIEIKQTGKENYINLYESAYYNANLLQTKDSVTHTETNKNYYDVSDKVVDPTYAVGIDDGYYYEVKTGSADEGTTEQEIAEMPSYTSHILGEFKDAQIRTGIKAYTKNKWIIGSRSKTKVTSPFPSYQANIKFDEKETLENQHVKDGEFVREAVKDDGFYSPITFIDKLPVTESGAMIFYIENTGSVDTEAHLHLGLAGSKVAYYPLQLDAEYSLLKDGTAEWIKYTAKDSGASNKGNVVIPANFNGWVKIPVTSFKNNGANIKSGELENIRYFPIKIGGRYGAINISHFMTVDEGSKDYYSIMVGDEEKSLLTTVNESYYTSTVTTKDTSQKENPVVRPKGSVVKATELTDLATPLGNQWGMHINAGTNVYYNDKPYIVDSNLRCFAGLFNNAKDSNGQAIILGPNSSVLVYVDHSDSTKSIYTAFGIGSGWYYTRADKKYYRMAENSVNWVEDTAVVLNDEGKEKNFGFVEIPAGFKGWIRIPASSVSVISGSNLKDITDSATQAHTRINVYPNAMGGDYGTLKVGGVRVLSENTNRIYINDDGSDTRKCLVKEPDLTIKKPTYEITVGSFLGDKNFTTTAPEGEIYSTIALKSDKVINTGEAIMFYASQNGTTQSSFAIGINDFEWSLITGAKYAVYNSKTQYWNSGLAGEDGKISIPAGFSGWVRIPYSSFTDDNKELANAEITISKINFTPYTLGGAWGDLKLGNFMVTNNGEEDIVTMRVDGGDEKPITKSKVYTGTTFALDSMYPAGINARTMSVKEFDHALLSGTSTYKLFANEEQLKVDLTSAVEIDLSAETSINVGDALLFYVDLESEKENTLIFGDSLLVKKGATYYTLGVGNNAEWKDNTTSKAGMLPLSAGFKGYVRIPAEAFDKLPTAFTRFVFGFENIGGEYNTPAFGTFMVIDNGNYDYLDICLNGATSYTSLIMCDSIEGYVLQGDVATRDDANKELSVSELGNTLTSEISTGYAYKAKTTGAPVSLIDKAYSPRLTFKIEDVYKSEMENAGGLMFYVSLPEGKSNRVFVQAQADNYARLSQGSAFWILPEGDGYWTKRVANVYNELPLPEGFKGWVRLDAKNIVTSANVPLTGSLSQINLSWRHIGGDWGEPEFGTFIMLKRNAESGKLKLRGQDEMNIYGSKLPTVYDRDDIAVWETIEAPFDGYADGGAYGAGSATIDTQGLEIDKNDKDQASRREEAEREAASVFNYKVISNIPTSADSVASVNGKQTGKYLNPFNSRGLELTSTEEVNLHGNQWPRFTFSHPFTLKDSKGIVLYVNLPENPEKDTNQLFVQLYSASGKTTSIKYRKTIATLADGTTMWKNVNLESQSLNLPSGFEGYIYIPNDAFETYKDAKKANRALNEFDDVYRMVVGIGHFGGSDANGNLKEEGKAYIGGMWLNKNGVLSHDGAYVDGDTNCRNIFTGEKVSEDSVRHDPFEKPGEEGWIFETLPEATTDIMAMTENVSGHTATIVWDKYEGADSYRVDIYQITAIGTGSFDEVYFTYLGSRYSEGNLIELTGLSPNTYYTVYIIPIIDGKGVAIYPPISVYTESGIIGDMLGYRYDPFEYGWEETEAEEEIEDITDTVLVDDGEEEEIEETEEEEEIEESEEEEEETTYLKKVTKRRKKKAENNNFMLIVIIVSAVALAGAIAAITIVLVKHKKKKAVEIINTEAGEDNIS